MRRCQRLDSGSRKARRATGRARCSFGRGLLAVLLIAIACVEVHESVPQILQGTWAAEETMYDGRTMEIGPRHIVFGVEDERTEHRVLGIVVEASGVETIYALDYAAENGAEYRLHLRYDLASGELRLDGRRQVAWRKVSS